MGAVAAGRPLNVQLSLWAPPRSGARLRGYGGGVEAQFLRRGGLGMQSGEACEGHSCSARVSSSLRTPRSPWSRGQGCQQWPLGSGTGLAGGKPPALAVRGVRGRGPAGSVPCSAPWVPPAPSRPDGVSPAIAGTSSSPCPGRPHQGRDLTSPPLPSLLLTAPNRH